MLHYFDRASMAHSLEVRVPFLDHEFVELCATIPLGTKVQRLTTKHVLKHAARGLVPDRIIDKPKVGFFNAGRWLVLDSPPDVTPPTSCSPPMRAMRILLDRRAVAQLLARYRSRRDAGLGEPLLVVVMLEYWLSTFLPRASALARAPWGRPAERLRKVLPSPAFVRTSVNRGEVSLRPH